MGIWEKRERRERKGSGHEEDRDEIVSEYTRHMYVMHSDKLTAAQANQFRKLCAPKDRDEIRDEAAFKEEIDRYATALKTLSVCLKKHHGENVIVLLDEYDVPLENAYYEGFYKEMVGFIRSLFESVGVLNFLWYLHRYFITV